MNACVSYDTSHSSTHVEHEIKMLFQMDYGDWGWYGNNGAKKLHFSGEKSASALIGWWAVGVRESSQTT